MVSKVTQELSMSLKDAKMDTQGASRAQYDAKMIPNDLEIMAKGTSKPQNDAKIVA